LLLCWFNESKTLRLHLQKRLVHCAGSHFAREVGEVDQPGEGLEAFQPPLELRVDVALLCQLAQGVLQVLNESLEHHMQPVKLRVSRCIQSGQCFADGVVVGSDGKLAQELVGLGSGRKLTGGFAELLHQRRGAWRDRLLQLLHERGAVDGAEAVGARRSRLGARQHAADAPHLGKVAGVRARDNVHPVNHHRGQSVLFFL
jgi:alkylhydroperoxidase family enzyme